MELLSDGLPSLHTKFASTTFWGPAKQGNVVLQDGFKMKWRNIGPGKVELRLPVMVGTQRTCGSRFRRTAFHQQSAEGRSDS